MKPHRPPPPEEGPDSWLMSYADMITLLMSFFVIFVATSEPRPDRLAAATKGLKEQFGTFNLDSPLDGVFRSIQGIIASNDADRNISVEKTPRGLQMELSTVHFFAGNTAEIASDQLAMLQSIAETLKGNEFITYTIEVEGHTGDRPSGNPSFATNWELAANRATRIVRLFSDMGVAPTRLRATSFAETRPAVPNEDALGRPIPENQARNQRVVIRVEKTK